MSSDTKISSTTEKIEDTFGGPKGFSRYFSGIVKEWALQIGQGMGLTRYS